ncbi:MAG TPA: hypothetical protein VHD87_13105 [Acidimicrobiales bacterium]|nr:hypothetical protein [Acidimicrobiales bacterium]
MRRLAAGLWFGLALAVLIQTAPTRGSARPVPAVGKPFVQLESREKAAMVVAARRFFGPRFGGAWVTESALHIGVVDGRRVDTWRLRARLRSTAVVVDATPLTYGALQRRLASVRALLPEGPGSFVFWEPVDEIDVVTPSADAAFRARLRARAAPLRVRLIVSGA